MIHWLLFQHNSLWNLVYLHTLQHYNGCPSLRFYRMGLGIIVWKTDDILLAYILQKNIPSCSASSVSAPKPLAFNNMINLRHILRHTAPRTTKRVTANPRADVSMFIAYIRYTPRRKCKFHPYEHGVTSHHHAVAC